MKNILTIILGLFFVSLFSCTPDSAEKKKETVHMQRTYYRFQEKDKLIVVGLGGDIAPTSDKFHTPAQYHTALISHKSDSTFFSEIELSDELWYNVQVSDTLDIVEKVENIPYINVFKISKHSKPRLVRVKCDDNQKFGLY